MSQRQAKKIGFFSALSICVGSIVGIGIFLKNAAVGKNVEGNGATWILTWIISGLIALLVAVHFGKISKVESSNEVTGISAWSQQLTTPKQKWFHKMVAFNYGMFYLAILGITLAFFTSELLVAFLQEINPAISLPVWAHALLALGFLVLFVLTNFFSYKLSGWISSMTLVLKFIPLLMAVLIGIGFANNHNIIGDNDLPLTQNGFLKPIDAATALKGMMLSLPSVLFAFDAFVGVGALSNRIEGGDKAVSKIIVFGMIFVTIIYTLISLASALHFFPGGTSIVNVLKDALPLEAARAISTFVAFFLFISAYGTSNAIIGVGVREFEHICYERRVVLADRLQARFGTRTGGLVLNLIVSGFWALVMLIPAAIQNSDSIVDGFSNLVVIYFFIVYIALVYLFWKNTYLPEARTTGIRTRRYSVLVWITIAAVGLALGLNLFFLLFDAIRAPGQRSAWGLYLDAGANVTNLYSLVTYLLLTPFFLGLPFLNGWLCKKWSRPSLPSAPLDQPEF